MFRYLDISIPNNLLCSKLSDTDISDKVLFLEKKPDYYYPSQTAEVSVDESNRNLLEEKDSIGDSFRKFYSDKRTIQKNTMPT
jgi:hypothetical protein